MSSTYTATGRAYRRPALIQTSSELSTLRVLTGSLTCTTGAHITLCSKHNSKLLDQRIITYRSICYCCTLVIHSITSTVFTVYLRGAIKKYLVVQNLVLIRIKLKWYLFLIVARLRTQHAQCDFWATKICAFQRMNSVGQMGVENANSSTHKFLKKFSNDTDVTQQKFISQLVVQDETCIHYFDSESEQ